MGGIPQVPFHPDESTYIFMSNDVDQLVSHPAYLLWQPALEGNPIQRYHEIDAPITRYLIGIGRSLLGYSTLPVDWNWSLDWQTNQINGAVPSPGLLLLSRLSVSFLFFFSLLLIYIIGSTIGRPATGLMAALLLGSNALILLHTRRAMAESALTFGILLSLLGFLKAREKPWLAAAGIAIAFNAKQTSLPLLLVGLLAIILLSRLGNDQWRKIIHNLGLYLLLFILITFALNPIYWNDPWHSIIASIQARQRLVSQQMADLQRTAPAQVLDTPLKRNLALIAHVYIAPPAVADTGNYLAELKQQTQAYFANPLNDLFRGMAWGGLFFALTLLGLAILINKIIHECGIRRSHYIIFTSAFVIEACFLIATITLPFQRYWLALVPFTCLLIATCCVELFYSIKQQLPSSR
jgi:4-amino-4-deoxy-L-arabinose transferase-like glycosyltransferase